MAIQTTDDSILWTSSTDDGTTWTAWQSVPGVTSNAPPSLAAINNTLYLSFIESNGSWDTIYLKSLTSSEENTWSASLLITEGAYASLITETVDEAEQLAVYYVIGTASPNNAGSIQKRYTQTPENQSSWQNSTFFQIDNQLSSGPLAATYYQGKTYLAYQAGTPNSSGGSIYLTTSSPSSTSNDYSGDGYNAVWTTQLIANVEAGTRTGVGLTSGASELNISY